MNKRNFLIFILLFFSKIFTVKCSDNPEEEGRYYARNDLKLFNQEYLDLVKEHLKKYKNERFYLFKVNNLKLNYEYEIVKEDGNKETKSEEKIIYKGSLTFNNSNIVGNDQDSTFAIFKDNFDNENNSKYLQYCNTTPSETNNKIIKEDNKYKIININPAYKCGDIKNNETDKPIIFQITTNDGNVEMYFCSNIEFIRIYNEKHSKNIKEISLFKNDKIKKVKIVDYIFDNKDKSYECDYLFHDCSNLEEINLDTDDKKINLYGKNMFSKCTNLKKIIMTKIHNQDPNGWEFTNCTNLKELTLNKNFNLGNSGCMDCTNLKTIKFVDDDENPFKGSIYCDGLCFINCENLENIEVKSIITNGNAKNLYNNCKKLKIPKTIIDLERERDIGFYNFDDMFSGVSEKYNDEINIQFNRKSKNDALPDFNYDKVFKGCDVNKINIIVKELDEIENGKVKKKGEEKILKDITKNDKIKWFICFPDNYIKLRQLYQNTSDHTLITFLNSKFASNQSNREIEEEYNEFKKQYEENNIKNNSKIKDVNDKNLGKCGRCGLLITKCFCCCKNR